MFCVPCIMDQVVSKYQPDVTLQYFYFLFFNISTCFGHELPHHQEITRLAAHAVSGEVTVYSGWSSSQLSRDSAGRRIS
jgi:hypothetical protein